DGGLYMPEAFENCYASLNKANASLHSIAENLISPFLNSFFSDDEIREIIAQSFTFDVPLVELNDSLFIAELFHGPTLAFKDFGGQFLGNVLSRILAKKNEKLTILVATSGDTGGAVASGFFGKENIDVVILYPKGKVSPLQELQLTTWGGNIRAVCVDGTFDDCQRLVKTAFSDNELSEKLNLSSANSINIGRLIPQMIYYGFVSHQIYARFKEMPTIVVPSGNFGNITAGLFVQQMGYPIYHFIAATNANDVVPKYLENGNYEPKPSVRTLSNAMDVGAPSNMERIEDLFAHNIEEIKAHISAISVNDEQTKATIKSVFEKHNYIADPHTAVGIFAAELVAKNDLAIVLSTAHPAKFKEEVEAILQREISLPKQLSALLEKTAEKFEISGSYEEMKSYLLK
ncbi:MAG TPA: threonine synthase, partial [Chitinophagales bacterium]